MKNNLHKAFTLVELIVVITILAVLATVAFISFQGYTSSSRDSVRLADLKNISKSFEITRTKDIDFPLPDKKVDITASGSIFQHQGELSQNILEKDLNIFNGGFDPLTQKPYGYVVNSARNKFQIIGFLENQDSVANFSTNTAFADNSDKYPKTSGDRLGVILDNTTNEIISDEDATSKIDILLTENTYGLLYGKNIEYGDKQIFQKIINLQKYDLLTSCQSILENYPEFQDKNDIYTISIDNDNIFNVYCDMTTDGGGWTVVGSDGGEILTQSLIEENSIPAPDVKGLNKYLISAPINQFANELRVVNINNHLDYHVYKIEKWMGNIILSDSEQGYAYNTQFGFSGGKTSPHKCNFSIIVKGTQGCTSGITETYPINGKEINATDGYPYNSLGAIKYSWQFKTDSNIYRLGWIPETKTLGNYYPDRTSSYIMIR